MAKVKEVDFDKVIEASEELKDYDGFLPLLIRAIIMKAHSRHLNKVGLYDEVIKEEIATKPKTYEEAVKELADWCKEHKEYKDLVH